MKQIATILTATFYRQRDCNEKNRRYRDRVAVTLAGFFFFSAIPATRLFSVSLLAVASTFGVGVAGRVLALCLWYRWQYFFHLKNERPNGRFRTTFWVGRGGGAISKRSKYAYVGHHN